MPPTRGVTRARLFLRAQGAFCMTLVVILGTLGALVAGMLRVCLLAACRGWACFLRALIFFKSNYPDIN